MTNSAYSFPTGFLSIVIAVAIVIVGIAVAIPFPELEWDTVILPAAQQYMDILDEAEIKNNSNNNNNIGGGGVGVDQQTQPLKGLVVVLTGATSGIGLGLTERLTQLGATLITVGSRSPEKLKELKESFPNSNLDTIEADLLDLTSVAKAANRIIKKYEYIDVLINNAGIHNGLSMLRSTASKQGYESSFGVNYLSHVLLSEKLMPLLAKSPHKHPKIVQVSSRFHYAVDGSDLSTQGVTEDPIASQVGGSTGFFLFRTQRQYANSKLAQILHARALHDRYYSKNGVLTVSACPTWVGTQIFAPKGTYTQAIFEAVAFPYNGFGISSILHAIFDTTAHTTKSTGNHNPLLPSHHDFYINTIGRNAASSISDQHVPAWTYQLVPLRDIVMASFAYGFLLPFQRLIPTRAVDSSSHASYDKTLQKELYDWSLLAISEWL